MITGLLLDVDDTLIDTRAAMVAAGEAAVAELSPRAGAAVHHAAGVHFHADPGDFFGRFTTGELTFAEMRQARVADLTQSFPRLTENVLSESIDEVCRRFEEAYAPAFAANVRLFDDVLPFLEVVGRRSMPTGLLTNSSTSYTQQKLELTGLTGAFAVVATRDTLGFGKPDARAFHHACRLLGSAPSETVYVGDHLEIDAMAARDAGLSAVWLRRVSGGARSAARALAAGISVVTSLSEVPGLLADS